MTSNPIGAGSAEGFDGFRSRGVSRDCHGLHRHDHLREEEAAMNDNGNN
jgi:hypothetical protein